MASTTTNQSVENQNKPINLKGGPLLSSELTRHNQHENRKTLQTLQYSTGVPISPIRKIVKPQKKNIIQKGQKPITVYVDPPQKRLDDKASQTEKLKSKSQSEAYDMLVSEEVPETYWKELAEERRKALNESLHENEMLHKEVLELKEQNDKLSKVASQAEYFAGVLKEVLGADEEKDENDSTESDEENKDNEKLPTDDLLLDDKETTEKQPQPETNNEESETTKDTESEKSTENQEEDKSVRNQEKSSTDEAEES